MTEKEIIEGNILIAEFMGWEKDIVHKVHGQLYRHPATMGLKWDFNFHDSWNWIMPVVEKISQLENVYGVELNIHHTAIHSERLFETLQEGINGVWFVVVNFIKWYNLTK